MSSLVALLREARARAPSAEALVDGERRVSYAALACQMDAVAGYLADEGLVAGDRVALLLDNSSEYVAAYYGVQAAGGIVVPLNTAARAHELSNWLRHCDARWLFASARHPDLGAIFAALESPPRLVLVGAADTATPPPASDWATVLAAPPCQPPLPEPDRPAAIIYTSGTTGEPKGVTLSHGNLAANVSAIVDYLGLGPSDRVSSPLPFHYSYGNSVLHTHLAAGACVVIERSLMYPHKILQRICEERVTGFSGVPSTYALLLARTRLSDYDLSSLRYLTQAGGAMSPGQIAAVREQLPRALFYVMYGQTEATARLAYLPPERLADKPGSVGVALPGTEIRILAATGADARPGEEGEICARGPHIMLGYWRDPAATARVLRDGWLHTGDLGYRDEEGFLYIRGRATEIIKVGAHRISPLEIEEAISECAGVADVAVTGMADPLLGQTIRAVVVARPDAGLDERAILAHCRARLAAYKLPRQVLFAAELPRTASGKIRRHLLPTQTTQPRAGGESC